MQQQQQLGTNQMEIQRHVITATNKFSPLPICTLIQCSQLYTVKMCIHYNYNARSPYEMRPKCTISFGQLAKLESRSAMKSENLHEESLHWSRTTARIDQSIKLPK